MINSLMDPKHSSIHWHANTPKRKQPNMKIPTQTNYLLRPCLAMALALAIGSPIQLQSASHAEGKGMMMDSKMMNKCQEIKKKKQQMQAKMKAQDAELTAAFACKESATPESSRSSLSASLCGNTPLPAHHLSSSDIRKRKAEIVKKF